MSMSRFLAAALALLTCTLPATAWANDGEGQYGLGQPATQKEIAGWNIDVSPSNDNAPQGSGTVAQGKKVYEQQCMACHGPRGQNGTIGPRLVGGQGSLATDSPVKTVGSYWPYASTLYDYIHRAMPLMNPQSLTPDQTYAVSAYILHLNGIIGADATLDEKSLLQVKMPNRNGFYSPDPRPDTHNKACEQDCRPPVTKIIHQEE